MDDVQAAREAWDAARDMVLNMLDRQQAAIDFAAYEAAEVAEYAARRRYYRTVSQTFGVPLPLGID